jgi:putative membrane-bound dehydrogenase-like protein
MRLLIGISAFFLIASEPSSDKPVPVSRSAQVMTVPTGFQVQLAAGEPTIVQPIAFTFDDRGRLWVVECLSYPKWSNNGQGKDRVVILEDPDEKGTYRKRTVVLDNGVNLSGLELGFGGLYLCSTPNFIFIPLNGDKPAGPPVVLLDGWNLKDAKHNVFNSLMWGPDGWLYGCNGIQTRSWVGKPGTPQDQRTFIDCGVWRFHPTKQKFEVYATGTTNPWGVDWDDQGEMFITNCVIDHLWHVVPGGRYQRMYGQDSNPYSYGHMGPSSDHKHWGGGHWTESRADRATGALKKEHDDAGGGHAHSGCAIYLGENFPKEYRNRVFMANIHGNRLNQNALHYEAKSTIVGKRAPDFLFANDPWFRGLCVKQGPEGALYVSDWSDTGECHNYDVADTTNGRIYRVGYGSPKAFTGNVSEVSDEQLLRAQFSENEWLVRKARRVLQERASLGKLPTDFANGLRKARTDKLSPAQQLRLHWLLFSIGQFDLTDAEYLLQQPGCAVWAIRLAATLPNSLELLAKAVPLAKGSSRIGGALAYAMMQQSPDEALRLAKLLFQNESDQSDTDLTLLYWLGIQPTVLAKPAESLQIVKDIRISRVRSNIARLVCSLPKSDQTQQLEAIVTLLSQTTEESTRQDVLAGVLQALEGRRQVKAPANWSTLYPVLAQSREAKTVDAAQSLALILGDKRVLEDLKQVMNNRSASTQARTRAIERLTAQKPPELAKQLKELLNDPAVRGAAIRGLANYSDPAIAEELLARYATFSADEKADALQTLSSRPAYAVRLLETVEKGQLARTEIGVFTARQIQALNDKALRAKLEKVWGTIRPASATRQEQTKLWKQLLTADNLQKATLSKGRQIYVQNCASCHKLFGEGGEVGPELTGSQRASLDYILENVLDPSAVVPSEYRMSVFNLIDGRTLTGIIRKETPLALTIRTLNEEIVIPTADIESRKPTGLSIMPDGLFEKLTKDEVRDLIAYLASKEQVKLPAK